MVESNDVPQDENGDQGFLMFVAENSGILTEDLERLFYNGFDNPESFGLIRGEDLKKLGVEEES